MHIFFFSHIYGSREPLGDQTGMAVSTSSPEIGVDVYGQSHYLSYVMLQTSRHTDICVHFFPYIGYFEIGINEKQVVLFRKTSII